MLPTIKDAKIVGREIASIKTRAGKLQTDIHAAAVQCLLHAEQHGDCTLASRLYAALPASQRRETLKMWFTTYSPLGYDNKAEQFKLRKGDKAPAFDVETANAHPYWETAETVAKPMTLAEVVKWLAALDKKIGKGLDDEDTDLSDADRAQIVDIRSRLPKVAA